MARFVTAMMLALVSALFGFFLAQTYFRDYKITLAARESGPMARGESIACEGIATVHLNDTPFAKKIVEAGSGAGQDTVSLKITQDGKGLLLLTALDIKNGSTDAGDAMPIVYSDDHYSVALEMREASIEIVLLDRENRNAIWSKSKPILKSMLTATSEFLECK